MRKLFYIANIRFPTERAHGIQVAYMCAAFARRHGADPGSRAELTTGFDAEPIDVVLLVPSRSTPIAEDPFSYYGVERNFAIERVLVPDTVRFGRVGFLIESFIFAFKVARRIRGERDAVIYTREEWPLLFLPRLRAFYEAHQLRRSSFFTWLIRRARAVIAITQGLANALVASGIPKSRMFVAHDGYDEKQFSVRAPKEEARKKLGLPSHAKIALYIGGLEPWKGAETLCKAAVSLERHGILVAIIGGGSEEVHTLQLRYPAVRFLGARPYRELSQNQQAADILVVPNSAKHEISKSFTSPLKLFAHLASGIVFCAARTPATEEVITWEQAFPFEPDDPEDLARVIARALSPEFLSERLSKVREAKKRAKDFTWDARASTIVGFLAA